MAAKGKALFAELFGFACFQGFLFALFVMGADESLVLGSLVVHRGSLFVAMLFAALALGILRALPQPTLRSVLRPPLMYIYGIVLVVATLALSITVGLVPLASPAAAIFQGLAIAPLLCAWGRLLGSFSLDDAAFVVIAGSVLGAVVSALCCLAPEYLGYFIISLLPLGAASALDLRLKERVQEDAAVAVAEGAASAKATDLSGRIMLGTFVFGVASGFAHSFAGSIAGADVSFPASLFIFFMLGIAALQIFFRPVSLMEGENASQFAAIQGAIAYVYRIAVLMMVAGFLFAAALQGYTFNGQSIVFAGFLGLLMVLMIVFLINAFTVSRDPAVVFSGGFALLLGGQAVGLAFGNLCDGLMDVSTYESWAFAVAGLLILVAFLFLFTENDLGELGSVAEAIDSFDEACEQLVSQFGLSKREAEILPLALKGRTGERIAEQFVISKSTVDTHLRRIYSKCGVHSRQELIDLGERTAEDIARRQRAGK